jgi:hypothetical protein
MGQLSRASATLIGCLAQSMMAGYSINRKVDHSRAAPQKEMNDGAENAEIPCTPVLQRIALSHLTRVRVTTMCSPFFCECSQDSL